MSNESGLSPSGAPTPSLCAVAALLAPVDEHVRAAIVEAKRWEPPAEAAAGGFDILIWGHRTASAEASLAMASRQALRRELTLRTMGRRLRIGHRVLSLHRIAPGIGGSGRVRAWLRQSLYSGVLLEIGSEPVTRVLDVVAEQAGITERVSCIDVRSGGALVVRAQHFDGTPLILRVGRVGTGADPAGAAAALQWLGGSGDASLVPRVLGRGQVHDFSWSAETLLTGNCPRRLTPRLLWQAGLFCATLPRSSAAPTSHEDDLTTIANAVPGTEQHLGTTTTWLREVTAGLPAILRHGDLWRGNLLVASGELSGVVDWDAAHVAGLPGTDLLQLHATTRRHREGLSLGAMWLRRPWTSEEFRCLSRDYWEAIDVRPDVDVLEAVGAAWWAAEVAGTLTRIPHRAADRAWLAANVEPVVARLGG